jgi:hypothetical protein
MLCGCSSANFLCKVTLHLRRAGLERMDVMRPDSFPGVFAEVTAADDAVLAHHLVAE